MKRPVTMPALSDTMNNGRLTRWLKQPGDAIKTGDAIAEVETDKATMEVEAFHDGYLAGPLAAANAELPVGQTIGFIADTATEAKAEAGATSLAPPPPAPAPAEAVLETAAVVAAPPIAVQAAAAPARFAGDSPRARARARHAAATLAEAPPPRPAVVQTAAQPVHDAPRKIAPETHPATGLDAVIEEGPPYRIERAPSMREAVAHNVASTAATPTFRVTARLSLAPLQALAVKQGLSLTILLARVCAATVAAHPLFNAAYTAHGLAHRERIDIGIAVDSPDGLFTPVLRDVAARPVAELARDWESLLGKVRARRLSLSDYRGATFYLSNLGTFPVVESFDAVVPPGASAILAVAAGHAEGASFTLCCDHRVVFGADAARFLQTLGGHLSEPVKLV